MPSSFSPMDNFDSYLQILGLERTATPTEIKKAYRKLAKQWHPDRYVNRPELLPEAQRKFREINRAYEILKDYKPREKITKGNRNASSRVNQQKTAPEVHYQRGVEFAEAEDYQAAIAEFSQAIKLDYNHLRAYQYRGFVLSKLGYELRANADFRQVDRLKTNFQTTTNQVRYQSNYRDIFKHKKKRSSLPHRPKFFLLLYQLLVFSALIIILFFLIFKM